jgi:hypothetical protein
VAAPRRHTPPAPYIISGMADTATSPAMFASLVAKGFEIMFVSHAAAIMSLEFRQAAMELENALSVLDLPISEIIGSGGGETKFTQRLRKSLAAMGWPKHIFEISKVVDGTPRESTSHEIDHVRRSESGLIALEIEWNNKDPFFDRDLENFKRLHAEGAISVGILITRGASLQDALWPSVKRFAEERGINDFEGLAQHGYVPTAKQRAKVMTRVTRARNPVSFPDAWTDNFVSNKYGQATTHWSKLMHRVDRGVGNPCPLILIGLPAGIISFDQAPIELLEDSDLEEDASP